MEFINLKEQYKVLKPAINNSIEKIMTEARFIAGQEIEELEKKLAAYIGRKYCISCGSGTDALMLAYLAYGVGKGDAVFCPDMTFIASIEPACLLGATPVFVDIDERTYNISPDSLEMKIIEIEKEGKLKPKAVVAVDFLGNPADMDLLSATCKKHNLILIEDSAQATGAIYKGKKCGSMGDIACTSFFPSKPLGCYGDGGAVFTDNDEIMKLINSYKVHGKGANKYDNVRIGINSRLDTIQAAILLAKLEVFEKEMEKRQQIAVKYNEAFKDILKVPFVNKDCRSSFAQYVLLADGYEQRTKILDSLKVAGIPSLLYYPKEMHRMDIFNKEQRDRFPNSTQYVQCNFGIPFSPYLKDEEQEFVIQTIKSVMK